MLIKLGKNAYIQKEMILLCEYREDLKYVSINLNNNYFEVADISREEFDKFIEELNKPIQYTSFDNMRSNSQFFTFND